MGKIFIGFVMIVTPGIAMASAKLLIDPFFRNQDVTLEGIMNFFVYGCIAGLILLVLRLLIRGGLS